MILVDEGLEDRIIGDSRGHGFGSASATNACQCWQPPLASSAVKSQQLGVQACW
jgi:hypothetical protein